jgi:ADP-heptose:LPS heptosyltransferase
MQRGKKRNRQLDLWVGMPLLNLLATFRARRKRPPASPQRIGVICSPALGDTLLVSGPLQDLRAAYPAAQIVHFCMKQNLAAAEIISGADKRVLISLTQPGAAIRLMRAERVHVMLDFTGWQRLTAFYTMLSGAKFTVGFVTPGQRRGRGYDHTVEHRADRHELENFRALLRGSRLEPAVAITHEPAVTVPAGGEDVLPEERDIVAFHLWASGQSSWLREWPEERWVELARRQAGPETLFVITGGPADNERTLPFVERMRAAGLRAQPFVSPDGFRTLTRLLRRVRLLVSVNTGVMHLGAVAGAPTVSLNGPTSERRWGARGRCCANVQPADGSGGYLHLGFEFDGQPQDIMERITVDQVEEACVGLARCRGDVVEVR